MTTPSTIALVQIATFCSVLKSAAHLMAQFCSEHSGREHCINAEERLFIFVELSLTVAVDELFERWDFVCTMQIAGV